MKSEEVARLAGVSRATVSRVINNYPNVPDETREKVMKVIREHNYVPNASARVLAGKGTNTLGLFILNAHDETRPGRVYGNSYLGPFLSAVVDRCNHHGYSVLIHTLYQASEYGRVQQAWSEKRIDGAIVLGTEKDEHIEHLIAACPCPLAIVDYEAACAARQSSERSRLISVNTDDDAGITAAIEHLASLGHTRIGFIGGRLCTWSAAGRLRAFKRRMKILGLSIQPAWMMNGDFSRSRTTAAMEALLSGGDLPTAILSANDDMALAAMEAIRRSGLRVPEDISVIGYDDGLAAPFAHPSLTTVRVPFFDMAEKAVEGLLGFLCDDTPEVRNVTLPVELILRDSTAIPNGG